MPRLLIATFFSLALLCPAAGATIASNTSIDDRDPLVLPFPAALETHDVYGQWQDEIHWDTSYITLSNGTMRRHKPSDATNSFLAGFKPWDELSFYLQTTLAFRNQSLQGHAQYLFYEADDDFPIDLSAGLGLGYSSKGGLLPEGQLVAGHTFKPAPRKTTKGQLIPGKGVTLTPQLVLGLRMLGHTFTEAAVDGAPGSPYAGAIQRRLVFDSLLLLEAAFKGFVARLGTGWESRLYTYSTHEDTAGARYDYQSGPMIFFSLGASFSTDAI